MKNKIWLILKKELREVFRDKKSLAMMLIIPFMIPLLVIGMSYLFDSQVHQTVYSKSNIGFAYPVSDIEKSIAKEMGIKISTGSLKEMKKLYQEEKIDLYITKKDQVYTIYYDQNDESSSIAVTQAEGYLEQYKVYLQNAYFIDHDMDSQSILNMIQIDYKTIGNQEDNFYANYITSYAFLFIIMAITISATYPATDTTAGEKERGTLETLLTFPIRSRDIILGKFFSVSISSIITGILSFALALISLGYVGKTFDIYQGIHVIPDAVTIFITILIIISYSFLISGLCIAIASLSKTFKEAQSALTPLTFISMFPGMIAFMLHLKTTTLISIIPFINYTQIFTDINSGNIHWIHILLMLVSTFVYIFIVIGYIIRQYKSENVLFSHGQKNKN